MSPDPLLAAPPPIPGHALAALASFVIGSLQLLLVKGTARHRLLGWLWVGLMALVAISGFFIHELRLVGAWSPIHLLSVLTLVTLVLALRAARRGDVAAHARAMKMLFWLALVLAGAFTFLPGRVMHAVLFGG